MAHYAFLNQANIVTEVITGKDETETIDGLTPEQWYENYRGQKCVRTSYNHRIRKQYAGIGYTYLESADVFITPKPYPSWNLDSNYDWQAPVERPADGKYYEWDEEAQIWVEIAVG
jgi:hypothetical protein